MIDRLVLQPPEIVETGENPILFLAGPIQGAPDWQTQAARIIHGLDSSVIVASPRRDYPEGTFVYEKQVDWETHFLRKAGRLGVVGFWLAAQETETPGRSYAQTSRFELGEWVAKHQSTGAKLVVGIEEGFGNARYIKRRLSQDCPDVPVLNSLQSTWSKAVELLDLQNTNY